MSGWPTLPIIIRHIGDTGTEGVDHVTAALEHNNRVVRISLSEVPGWQLEIFVALMKKPFPELTGLDIAFTSRYHFRYFKPPPPVFPDSFLGGSAPSLQSLRLDGIPFPGLPKLLLSSHGLVDIDLYDIPSSGYIPPEEMATCLSPMKHLKSLKLKFNNNDSPSLTTEQHSPSLTRIVLPALTSLSIHCTSEFLEGFVSRLDAPSLEEMDTEFPRYDAPVSNITELPRFISRIETFETFDKADIHNRHSEYGGIEFIFSEQESSVAGAELTSLTLTFTQSGGPDSSIRSRFESIDAGCLLILTSTLPFQMPDAPRAPKKSGFHRRLSGGCQRHPNARNFVLVHCRDEYIHIPIDGSKCIAYYARTLRGKSSRNVTRAAKYLRGEAPKTREGYSRRYSRVCCCERARRSNESG